MWVSRAARVLGTLGEGGSESSEVGGPERCHPLPTSQRKHRPDSVLPNLSHELLSPGAVLNSGGTEQPLPREVELWWGRDVRFTQAGDRGDIC